MWHSWSVSAVRQVESAAVRAAATDQLMLKAARAVADAVRRHSPRRVVAFVGGGDNGGDALYALSVLAKEEIPTLAVIASDHPHARALAAAHSAGVEIIHPFVTAPQAPSATAAGSGVHPYSGQHLIVSAEAIRQLEAAAKSGDVWIDALLGTGARGLLREPVATTVSTLARCHREFTVGVGTSRPPAVIAVDVHSGTCEDNGKVENPMLRADEVVTMGAVKASLALPPACYYRDRITLVDLGMDMKGVPPATTTLEAEDVAPLFGPAQPLDHKYTRAVVRTVCGCARYPGAGVLAALAAQYSGASMVRVDAPAPVTQLALAHEPGLVCGSGRAQAIVVGSGLEPNREDDRQRIEAAFKDAAEAGIPLVVDAGALPLAARWERSQLPQVMVWTPHAGEAAELLTLLTRRSWERSEVEACPRLAAQQLCELTGATVVLKGAATLVVGTPSHDTHGGGEAGVCYVQAQAPGWAATAGSGDVLAGVVGTALATVQVRRERQHETAAGESASMPLWPDLETGDPNWDQQFIRASASGVWLHGTAASLAAGADIHIPLYSAAKLAARAEVGPLTERGAEGRRFLPRPGADRTMVGRPITALDIARHLPLAVDFALQRRR